jgi:hypothetical protein
MTNEKKVEEATAMAGGAVAGAPSKNFMIDRKKFLEELQLRESIRKIALKSNKKKNLLNEQEQILRKAIRNLLLEADAINFLEDLLKRILPTIERDYKSLTTSPEQRESFRSQFVYAVESAMSTIAVNMVPQQDGGERKFIDIDEDVEIEIEDDDIESTDDEEKFIDIDREEKEVEAEKSEKMTLDTGSKLAAQTFDSVEKQISETFETLSDKQDQETFEDYLVTNLKLYFDKYERELSDVIEPTTAEYEAEKNEEEAESEE